MSLYQRFCQLDRNNGGFISGEEFLSVPEFAVNPLSLVCTLKLYFSACYYVCHSKIYDEKFYLILGIIVHILLNF